MLRSCGRDREKRRGLQGSLKPKARNAAKNSMRRRTSFCARAVKSLVEAPCMMDGRRCANAPVDAVKGVGFSIELGEEALFENRTSCGSEMRRGSPCSCGRGDDWKPPEHVLSGLRVSRICDGGPISKLIDAGTMRFCFRAQSLDVIGREASRARLITNEPER